ncbi:MAG: type II secretion system protein [Elusimicrobiaceae bacterium]|nr:type II secretion system protein [Elusimicrobiaceae bacterium]
MNNKNGFTLTEILLAVMIVGVIGIALAALTTAAVRESGTGRTRLMLRNQISLAMRQLRQDIHESTEVLNTGIGLTLSQSKRIGPEHEPQTVTYTYAGGKIMRNKGGSTTVWLDNVLSETVGDFNSPAFFLDNIGEGINSVLRVNLIVGVDDNKSVIVKEAVDETFVLPHGFAIQNN